MRRRFKLRHLRNQVIEVGWWAYSSVGQLRMLRNRQQWRTWLDVVLKLAPWQSRRLRSRAAPFMTWTRYQP